MTAGLDLKLLSNVYRYHQTNSGILTSLLLCCLGLLLGCTLPHYVAGRGDAGQFMLQHALSYGGRPIVTNDLPVLEGDWKYIEDQFGVGLVFPASRYADVESFLTFVFGPRPGHPGWGARDVGVAILLGRSGTNTLVGIHPPALDVKK